MYSAFIFWTTNQTTEKQNKTTYRFNTVKTPNLKQIYFVEYTRMIRKYISRISNYNKITIKSKVNIYYIF